MRALTAPLGKPTFRLFAMIAMSAVASAILTLHAYHGSLAHERAMVIPEITAGRYGTQKVAYHITEGGGWFGRAHTARLASLSNHVKAVGKDKITIEVVLQGQGADLLVDARTDPALAVAIDRLRDQGVHFVVCRNTMQGRHVGIGDLYGVTPSDVVPAAVAEVADLIQKGYALVRL